MKRADKESFVADFRTRLNEAPVLYLTDFSGLDVKSITVLRDRLHESGADYLVVKNRLLKRALEASEMDLPDLSEHLKGPTAVVLAGEGPVGPAKALTEFAKQHGDRPVFKVGILDQQVVAEGQFKRLATLPSRDELLAQLAGALEAPMASLAGVLQAKLQETAGLLDALREKKAEEG
ncbi:MAG: 50S ribosomal protein L10 [Gemmatimonadales bacterium]|nr:MAG: 50S ribosomal protein L10 [Gemmatimonadales bacterium]